MLPPGRHYFWFRFDDHLCVSSGHPKSTVNNVEIHDVVIPLRLDEIPLCTKPVIKQDKTFDKKNSVFKAFRVDSVQQVKAMVNADRKFSKIFKIIRKEDDLA